MGNSSKALQPVKHAGELIGYALYCPGCDEIHVIRTASTPGENALVWSFNGDIEQPTFTPSLLNTRESDDKYQRHVCHCFIRGGRWEFLSDCTHQLAGQSLPLVKYPFEGEVWHV